MKFVLSTSFSSVAHLTQLAPVADTHGWHAMSFSDHVANPQSISTPYPVHGGRQRRWPPFHGLARSVGHDWRAGHDH